MDIITGNKNNFILIFLGIGLFISLDNFIIFNIVTKEIVNVININIMNEANTNQR
ncbi:hypothetical protein J6P52_00345 [bacterium]|nr:hypothetical protein [bacterium]MBO6041629.1 hypothetical protein [bacterium]